MSSPCNSRVQTGSTSRYFCAVGDCSQQIHWRRQVCCLLGHNFLVFGLATVSRFTGLGLGLVRCGSKYTCRLWQRLCALRRTDTHCYSLLEKNCQLDLSLLQSPTSSFVILSLFLAWLLPFCPQIHQWKSLLRMCLFGYFCIITAICLF